MPHASRPAVAAAESWNPASVTVAGVPTTMITMAHASARAAVPGRPVSRANRATPAITAARRTDGEAPARIVYSAIAPTVATARRRRAHAPSRAATSPATSAMFQPEMATTWERPVVVKSAARSRSTRSRSPIRMPAARSAAGSGSVRASASPASARMPWTSRSGLSGAGSARTERVVSVAETPVRAR